MDDPVVQTQELEFQRVERINELAIELAHLAKSRRWAGALLKTLAAPEVAEVLQAPGAHAYLNRTIDGFSGLVSDLYSLEQIEQEREKTSAAHAGLKHAQAEAETLRDELGQLRAALDQRTEEALAARRDADAWRDTVSPFATFPLERLRRSIQSSDWDRPRFAAEKALAGALMSELAYLRVPESELADSSRFKLVPSHAYQFIVEHRLSVDFIGFLNRGDFGLPIVFEVPGAVFVGVATPTVVIVGVRGTATLYDTLAIDPAAWKESVVHAPGLSFHSGFYRTAVAAFGSLSREIRAKGWTDTPVCFTGHSMGASVASICHALWRGDGDVAETMRHCYGFAMPRYAHRHTIPTLRQPFHLYGSKDVFPAVPPRWLGYGDTRFECSVDSPGSGKGSIPYGVWQGLLSAWNRNGFFRHHMMEVYRRDVTACGAEIEAGLAAGWRAW
jgi:hypothetical protein